MLVNLNNYTGQGEQRLPKLSFTLSETALVTGLSERTIRRLIARKLLRKSLATRRILVARNEIEKFLTTTSA